jgi:hypothetical protein
MTFVIDDILAGKAIDIVLGRVRDGYKEFRGQPDALGRLLVLLHAEFGRECDLGRDVFYSWRARPELQNAFEGVLSGQLLPDRDVIAAIAALLMPRLKRTTATAQSDLAERIAQKAFAAAPIVVQGGGEDTLLLVSRLDDLRRRQVPHRERRTQRVRFKLPLATAYFTGREVELAAVHRALGVCKRAIVTQAIVGPAGVGKTQIAARYAHTHADEYEIVVWIRAEDGGVQDLAELAVLLGFTAIELSPSERAAAVLRWLCECDERWLLVLDNLSSAEQLPGCCPSSGRGDVIVTTRDRAVAQFATTLTVDVFDTDTAVRYLVERARRPQEKSGALRLAEALGFLPLALSHAGAFCDGGMTFDEYLGLVGDLPTSELFDSRPDLSYEQTVASTWKVSIEAASAQAPLAQHVLDMAAHLGPDGIPRSLLEVLIDPGSPRGRKRLGNSLYLLSRFSLATVDDSNMSIHRLLQKSVRDDALDHNRQCAAGHALKALDRAFPKDVESPDHWPVCEQLLAHVVALANTARGNGSSGRCLVDLLSRAVRYLRHAGGDRRQVPVAELACVHASSFLGAEHTATLAARTELALAYRSAGRTGDAIASGKQLVADCHRILGPYHRDTLRVRGNLSIALRSSGAIDQAIELGEQVLADRRAFFGPHDPHTVSAEADLVFVYQLAGRTDDAIAMGKRVVSERTRTLGRKHSETLIARINLAWAYEAAGETVRAIKLGEMVLSDCEAILGGVHRETVRARGNLSASFRSARRLDEAIALGERVLDDRDRILGSDHPNSLHARVNVAASYRAAGRTADAMRLGAQALSQSERLLGTMHPTTVQARAIMAASTEADPHK